MVTFTISLCITRPVNIYILLRFNYLEVTKMPIGKDWREHFQRLPVQKITRIRNAIKLLLTDTMFKEHYPEFYRLDSLLEAAQEYRKKKE